MEEKKLYGIKRPESPYTDAECEQIISKLEMLLDGELDKDSEKDVADMVNNCQYCLEQYKIEKSLRQLVKEGFQNMFDSNSLVNSIRNKIRGVKQNAGS